MDGWKRGGASARDPASALVQIAVVSDPTGAIRLIEVAPSRERLYAKLARYVSREAEVRLCREMARRVRGLVDAGKREAAIALYFGAVGERWDEECLSVDVLPLE